jgi:hypothetical protein
MTKNINDNSTRYIVVAFHKGFPYLLQYKGVLSNVFYNNSIKTFKTKETAIKNAIKISHKYKASSVKVYEIDGNSEISSSMFKENDNKHIYQYIPE